MRFIDENCGNCLFFITKEETLKRANASPEMRDAVDRLLEMESDCGDSCLRYPEVIETIKSHWCGEWKSKDEVKLSDCDFGVDVSEVRHENNCYYGR